MLLLELFFCYCIFGFAASSSINNVSYVGNEKSGEQSELNLLANIAPASSANLKTPLEALLSSLSRNSNEICIVGAQDLTDAFFDSSPICLSPEYEMPYFELVLDDRDTGDTSAHALLNLLQLANMKAPSSWKLAWNCLHQITPYYYKVINSIRKRFLNDFFSFQIIPF